MITRAHTTAGASSPHLRLAERIEIANSIAPDVLKAVEKFHRQSSLLRRTRFGTDITPFHDGGLSKEVTRRQPRLSEKRVASMRRHPQGNKGELVRSASQRSFAPLPHLLYATVAELLHRSFTAGLDESGRGHAPYPSAGAIYAVQVFVAPLMKVTDAPFDEDAVLHLALFENALYQMPNASARAAAVTCLDCAPGDLPNSFSSAALMLTYAVDVELSSLRYAERGYRFSLIEAGAMAQQATLVAQHLGFDTCLFGGFPDAELAAALGLHSRKMLPCLVQFFGGSVEISE